MLPSYQLFSFRYKFSALCLEYKKKANNISIISECDVFKNIALGFLSLILSIMKKDLRLIIVLVF